MANIKTFEKLTEMLESAGYMPRDYSGRAMYGRRCVGVTVEPSELLRVGAALAEQAIGMLDPDTYVDADELHDAASDATEDVAELMRGARSDDMGRDVIVYWPEVEWDADYDTVVAVAVDTETVVLFGHRIAADKATLSGAASVAGCSDLYDGRVTNEGRMAQARRLTITRARLVAGYLPEAAIARIEAAL